jgi:hypothetical protein
MVERSDRNSDCSGGRRLLISRKFFRRVERIFSKTFLAMFRRVGWVFSRLGDHDRGGMFPGQGEMVGVHAIIKNSCKGNNGSPREVFKYGGFKFDGPRGLSAFQQLDVRFHLVRKNLDDESVFLMGRDRK